MNDKSGNRVLTHACNEAFKFQLGPRVCSKSVIQSGGGSVLLVVCDVPDFLWAGYRTVLSRLDALCRIHTSSLLGRLQCYEPAQPDMTRDQYSPTSRSTVEFL